MFFKFKNNTYCIYMLKELIDYICSLLPGDDNDLKEFMEEIVFPVL